MPPKTPLTEDIVVVPRLPNRLPDEATEPVPKDPKPNNEVHTQGTKSIPLKNFYSKSCYDMYHNK